MRRNRRIRKGTGEVIKAEKVTEKEFMQLVAEGEFMHGAGLAAWAGYLTRMLAKRYEKKGPQSPFLSGIIRVSLSDPVPVF